MESATVETNAKKAKSKGKIVMMVFLVIIVSLVIFGANWYIQQQNYVSTDNAKVSGDILNVPSKVPGKVISVNVQNGSQVKKGDILFIVENEQITKAPADGTVIQVSAHVGDSLVAGQAAVSLVDLNNLRISAFVMETDIERIKVDQAVDLTIDALPGQKFKGTIAEVGLATASTFSLFSTDNTSGSYTKVSQRVPLKINFDYIGQQVFPGMSVTAKIHVR